jgi:hypothetical protein
VVFHTDDGGQYTGFNISARGKFLPKNTRSSIQKAKKCSNIKHLRRAELTSFPGLIEDYFLPGKGHLQRSNLLLYKYWPNTVNLMFFSVFRPSLMDILAVPSITEDGTNTNQSSNDISTGESSSTPAVQHTSERSNMTGNSSTEDLDQELQNSNAGAALTITTNTSVNTFADVTFSPTDASTQDLVNLSSTTESERADSPAPENVEEAGQQI